MGLFSKKTLICEKCGKEFQARITIGRHLCKECDDKYWKLYADVQGYNEYAMKMSWESYTEEQLKEIQQHRNKILEKYDLSESIGNVRKNLKGKSARAWEELLSKDEGLQAVLEIFSTQVSEGYGSAMSTKFFSLTDFKRTVVDMEDVFAVGLTSNCQFHEGDVDTILCVLFTNYPYIPVAPTFFQGKLKLFELGKSKKTRKHVTELFELICPNLTYPVQELKSLKKQIKSEENVKGNIDKQDILKYISKAETASGIFNLKKMEFDMPMETEMLFEDYGYPVLKGN